MPRFMVTKKAGRVSEMRRILCTPRTGMCLCCNRLSLHSGRAEQSWVILLITSSHLSLQTLYIPCSCTSRSFDLGSVRCVPPRRRGNASLSSVDIPPDTPQTPATAPLKSLRVRVYQRVSLFRATRMVAQLRSICKSFGDPRGLQNDRSHCAPRG